jgi:hypothetical protein
LRLGRERLEITVRSAKVTVSSAFTFVWFQVELIQTFANEGEIVHHERKNLGKGEIS